MYTASIVELVLIGASIFVSLIVIAKDIFVLVKGIMNGGKIGNNLNVSGNCDGNRRKVVSRKDSVETHYDRNMGRSNILMTT